MPTSAENMLGVFLRDCRERLDPSRVGLSTTRRRTPGLRREEVAQRASVSTTWYTWLEQGRGGGPSAEALDRVAGALSLSAAEREHLFALAQRRQPDLRNAIPDVVTPQLQRTLDAFELNPALVITSAWDIVAWNRAASLVLTDYAALAREDRNVLKLLFCNARVRAAIPDWDHEARCAVARFRLSSFRTGASEVAAALAETMCAASAEFAAMWHDNEVSIYGEGVKHLRHPVAGALALEYSSFAVDGQPALGMVVYTPATATDRERIRALVSHEG